MLSVVENAKDVPFEFKRVFVVSDSFGCVRGGHRNKNTTLLLFSIGGDFEIFVDNGKEKRTYILNHLAQGLVVEQEDWHTMKALSKESTLIIIASTPYDLADYIDQPYDDA